MAKEVRRELVVAAVVTATNYFYRYLVSSYPTTTNPYASEEELYDTLTYTIQNLMLQILNQKEAYRRHW
jgi:hypothetical protein